MHLGPRSFCSRPQFVLLLQHCNNDCVEATLAVQSHKLQLTDGVQVGADVVPVPIIVNSTLLVVEGKQLR